MRIHNSVLVAAPLFAVVIAVALFHDAGACSCAWSGSFLTVAPRCPLVVEGAVAEQHVKDGLIDWIDVDVREVFHGYVERGMLRIYGDRGWLCRPSLSLFPVGTEWVFALNGPGSKPAMDPGYSLSVCGQYWLRVANGTVIGNIADDKDMNASERFSLDDFRVRCVAACGENPAGRERAVLSGEVAAGEVFERPFGPVFRFRLEPTPAGWLIVIRDERDDEDIARLTPPFHFVPNPREIESWHFRNSSNTGPNEAGPENVNAPGLIRDFVFSPEVGRMIAGSDSPAGLTEEDIERVKRFGRGTFRIAGFSLVGLEPGSQARFAKMRFDVELSWPAAYRGFLSHRQ